MKNVFTKATVALMAAFALTGCTVSEYSYDSTGTGSEYSINIVDKSDVTEAPAVQETEHVRHVRLDTPLTIKVDGSKKEAVVMPS